jgi:predicted negative regulator of RcsB-dependent stress response
MAFDLEEQEQIDELKQFWKQYGSLIVTLVIAALATIAGVQGWKYYKRTQAEAASALYLKFEEVVRKNDVAEIRRLGAELVDKHGSSAYGPMAALVFAKSEYDNGDPAAAEKRLRWAIDNAHDDETAELARLRLAGMLLDQKKHDEALKLLEAKHGSAMETLYADLRGDILLAQGKLPEARAAYKLALDKALPNSSYRNVVQIKLDALGSAK